MYELCMSCVWIGIKCINRVAAARTCSWSKDSARSANGCSELTLQATVQPQLLHALELQHQLNELPSDALCVYEFRPKIPSQERKCRIVCKSTVWFYATFQASSLILHCLPYLKLHLPKTFELTPNRQSVPRVCSRSLDTPTLHTLWPLMTWRRVSDETSHPIAHPSPPFSSKTNPTNRAHYPHPTSARSSVDADQMPSTISTWQWPLSLPVMGQVWQPGFGPIEGPHGVGVRIFHR